MVWGTSRSVVNRVLFGIAQAVVPAPYWVEIRARPGETDEPGPASLGWIGPDRLFFLGDLMDAGSDSTPAAVPFALISFLREPSAAAISEAMRLPQISPEAATMPGSSGPRPVVAIANVERAEQLWSETPRAMQAVVKAFLAAGVVPYFSTLRPSKRRLGADLVFRVVAASLGEWRTGTLACEKAPEGTAWREGDSLPLTHFPSIAGALSGKIDPATR